ncbi:fasciclin domain-containing protein [Streptosporangium album]|uniref:fasciclin domain-containing protein n=1 Tax=Streptosporangium album TaxID=47479 RepID=UPI0031EB5384
MKKKSLLASTLTVLALAGVPAAAQAATTSSLLRISPTPMPTDMTSESPTDMTSEAPGTATKPFGPGCSSLPTSGPGSPSTMATEPIGTALSDNPELSTLAKAIEQAGLTDTLNSAKDITVFAPTNEAFAKLPKETLDKVLADKAQLTKVLQNHVVEGRKTPADLAEGTLTTLGGGTLTVKGSGEEFTVNDAKILCGNLQTSNATVYLVDSVLLPEAGASPS